MSGHSKWAQIKHAKGAADKKKGLAFSKIVRQITVAVRDGGPDLGSNFKLRLAVEKAREAEMPKDNIDRAIEKASGAGDGNRIEQATYEGFGPAGTAFIIEAATDNKNRTSANIRHLLEKNGGNMGQPGSVAWNFESRGEILAERDGRDATEMELLAIDAGAEDVEISDEGLTVYTAPADTMRIKQVLDQAGLKIASAEIVMHPKSPVAVPEHEQGKVRALLEALSADDEVIAVHTSAQL